MQAHVYIVKAEMYASMPPWTEHAVSVFARVFKQQSYNGKNLSCMR